MSSPTAASAVEVVEEKPVRRFPPPCWTQEETLALIDAYRERWYALRRGYLRTPDWEAVAAAVTTRCPDASPAKTSAQCRHKMEKLRQRYRAERQRSLAFPTGRFFSAWFFFENMDAMESGTPVPSLRSNQANDPEISGNGFPSKALFDPSLLRLKLNPKSNAKIDGNLSQSSDLDRGVINGKIDEKIGSRYGSSAFLDMGSNTRNEEEEEEEEEEVGKIGISSGGGFHAKNPVNDISSYSGYKMKKFGKILGDLKNGFDLDRGGGMESGVNNIYQPVRMVPPGNRMKKLGKADREFNYSNGCDEEGESYGVGVEQGIRAGVWNDRSSDPAAYRGNYRGNLENNLDSRFINPSKCSASRIGVERKNGEGGAKRGRDPIEEMVMSIKMLGEGFVKMEQMKMEMATEMEKMRMEMEMKRNEMILQSQQQIVDAFAKVICELNNKKMKTSASTPEE